MSTKTIVRSITALISSISALLVTLNFLQGLTENSYDTNAILTYSLTFLISYYVFGALTEEVYNSIKKLLAFFGIPTFIISLIIAFVSLIA